MSYNPNNRHLEEQYYLMQLERDRTIKNILKFFMIIGISFASLIMLILSISCLMLTVVTAAPLIGIAISLPGWAEQFANPKFHFGP